MHVSNTHLYSRNSACAWRFLLCLRVGSPLAKTLLGGLDAKPFYGSHLKCLIRLDPFLNSIIAYDDWRERGAWQKGGKVLHICQRLSARAPKAPVICDTPTAALFNAWLLQSSSNTSFFKNLRLSIWYYHCLLYTFVFDVPPLRLELQQEKPAFKQQRWLASGFPTQAMVQSTLAGALLQSTPAGALLQSTPAALTQSRSALRAMEEITAIRSS